MTSKTTLIFGGSGKVAKHLTRQLTSPPNNHTVYSIIRKESQKSDVESLGGKPILQSIEDSSVSDMLATMTSTKPSAVVWAAGAGGQGGPERTVAVDRDGAIRAMDAAAQAGVKRFVMVSAVDIRDRDGKPEPEWYDDDDRKRSEGMWGAIGRYCAAKLAADRELVVGNQGRGLEWTIVRPTSLGEGAGTGRVEAGRVHLAQVIPREDVAAVIVECLRNDGTKGLAFDVVGGNTPIPDAIAHVAKERVDCFEGRY